MPTSHPAGERSLEGVPCAFIRRHEGWVRRQAQTLVHRLPANVERADLVQAGLIAIAQCYLSFDWDGDRDSEEGRGAFSRYARMRVKGAMLDQLRDMDYLSRGERQKVKRITLARERHLSASGRQPGLVDLALLTGLSAVDVAVLLHADQLGRMQVCVDDDLDVDSPGQAQPATAHDDVPDRAAASQTLQRFAQFVDGLPDRERLVMEAYLGWGSTPIQAAAALGVTPSRVSQIFRHLVHQVATTRVGGQAVAPAAPKQEPRRQCRPSVAVPAEDLQHLFSADIVRGCGVELLSRQAS